MSHYVSHANTNDPDTELGDMNEYRVIIDEKHVIELLSRFREQRITDQWFTVVKTICAAGLVALMAIVLYAAFFLPNKGTSGLILIALVPAFFLFLLLLGPRIDYFFLKRGMKKSPHYGNEAQITVTDSGVSVQTPISHTTLSWSVFTQARRLAHGYLLFSGPSDIYWWPDSALTAGTPDAVALMLRANVTSYVGP